MNTTRKEFLTMMGGAIAAPSVFANSSEEERFRQEILYNFFVICPIRKENAFIGDSYDTTTIPRRDSKIPYKYNAHILNTVSVLNKNREHTELFYDHQGSMTDDYPLNYKEALETISKFNQNKYDFKIQNAFTRTFCVCKVQFLPIDHTINILDQRIIAKNRKDVFLPWSKEEDFLVSYFEAKKLIIDDCLEYLREKQRRDMLYSELEFHSTGYQILSSEVLKLRNYPKA